MYKSKFDPAVFDSFREKTGLPMSTYFSALKLRWLLDNVPEVYRAYEAKRLRFGTVDSWLLYKLLNGVHATDVTNASRTMLMNLQTLKWDPDMLSFFNIDAHCLPEIKSSAEEYGKIHSGPFEGIPLTGVLGDQQAALVGHKCFEVGQTKNTYGSGCFLLINTGEKIVPSKHGMLSTVAFQFGPSTPACYANEGAIAMSGKVFDWLKATLGLIRPEEQIDALAAAVTDTNGVKFLPTFTGIFTPYWRGDITG
jgi:glycerol kinase